MTTFVQGVPGYLLSEWFEYAGGPLVNLDATPNITITNLATSAVVLGPTTSGITNPATGIYRFPWTPAVNPANYLAVWNGLSNGDAVQASEIVNVLASATGGIGPCAWDITTVCCDGFTDLPEELQVQATQYATLVLWSATGRQFGECPITVRPCGRWCEDGGWDSGWWWSDGTWVPYISGGVWRNCWCGDGGPGCRRCAPHCQVYLPGPVNQIVQVLVDGDVVAPHTYRVDDQVWLVRLHHEENEDENQPCWPWKQDYSRPTDENHTFEVTYTRGTPVPAALLNAAGTLACEYAKACQGQACRLPSRVASVARQGVSVTFATVAELMKYGLTGLKEVDDVIRALNPNALKGRTRFYSPDMPVTRMKTYP